MCENSLVYPKCRFIEGSYRIIYWIKAEQIEVIAVVHGSRQMY